MSTRKRRNNIHLVTVNGNRVEGVQNVRAAVFNHFSEHFKLHAVVRPDVSALPFRKLSYAQAGDLTKPFSLEEVKQAVWDCDSFKSPRPDGVSFGFLKHFWDMLKIDFMKFMVEFHRNGKLTKGLNSTFIALIPKVLAKVLANRLRGVLESVISDSQSAFVKGQQILDGILIANEVVDEARRMNKELLMFKVDFQKAYDSVDLNYLDSVMRNMNFPTLWQKWIHECVGTATASVLVNGCPTDEFTVERGLRQGDPLSPFLFLLAAKGFNILMNAMVEAQLFRGYGMDVMGKGSIPFVYLGLPIGGDFRKLSFWKPFIDHIVARLSSWNNKFLSFGGRLILLKYVLSSLPIFLGGSEDNRKIAWIKWDSICVPKEDGGLGVRRLGEFNLSLLGKWCWRMLVDKEGLWYRVLKARYGEEGGRLKEGVDLVRLGGRCFVISAGGGGERVWGIGLKCTVAEMEREGWEEDGRAWLWRRRLFAWEEECVRECSILLLNVVLQVNVTDKWCWALDTTHGYTVREAYRFVTNNGDKVDRSFVDNVWHKSIPTKVSLFVWRLLRN
uniref:RNA-directed DNA polymerase (Reverse transcriptase) n=1 Tax=Medicago truncatula TaxID=3880 RepID=Q1SKV6_MEDTR|nr:RNA-directed DNA polymerase (Reverse transcriptase) [Medicago truncatula]